MPRTTILTKLWRMEAICRAAVCLSVDCDEDFEGVELPAAFTCRALDSDETQAAAAGQQLRTVESTLLDLHGTLELYERALREAEPYSARARQARTALRETLAALEPAFAGVDRAQLALVARWGSPPNPAGNPPPDARGTTGRAGLMPVSTP